MSRALFRCASVFMAALGCLILCQGPTASAATATISGKITRADTAIGVDGITVRLYKPNINNLPSPGQAYLETTTAGGGLYSFSGIPLDAYGKYLIKPAPDFSLAPDPDNPTSKSILTDPWARTVYFIGSDTFHNEDFVAIPCLKKYTARSLAVGEAPGNYRILRMGVLAAGPPVGVGTNTRPLVCLEDGVAPFYIFMDGNDFSYVPYTLSLDSLLGTIVSDDTVPVTDHKKNYIFTPEPDANGKGAINFSLNDTQPDPGVLPETPVTRDGDLSSLGDPELGSFSVWIYPVNDLPEAHDVDYSVPGRDATTQAGTEVGLIGTDIDTPLDGASQVKGAGDFSACYRVLTLPRHGVLVDPSTGTEIAKTDLPDKTADIPPAQPLPTVSTQPGYYYLGARFEYRPDVGYLGYDSFTYVVYDGEMPGDPTATPLPTSVSATVGITVTPRDINNYPPEITAGPTATPEFPKPNETVTFSVTADDPEGRPITIQWTFPDASTQYGETATKSWAALGQKTIDLLIWDDTGKQTQKSVTVTVTNNEPPILNAPGIVMTPAHPEPGEQVAFSAAATDADTPQGSLTFDWKFGDGAVATGSDVTHTYAASGKYTVEVTVTDDAGLTDTASLNTTVTDKPVFNSVTATPSTAGPNDTITFTADVSDPDQYPSALTVSWDFGDGDTASDTTSTTHSYTSSGTYTVVASATDGVHVVTSAVVVTVTDAPVISADGIIVSPSGTVKPTETVNFSVAASDPDAFPNPLTATWDFGDGTAGGSGLSPSHAFTSPGAYTVTATVSDGALTDSATTNILVTYAPVINGITVAPSEPESNQNITFSVDATDPDGFPGVLTMSWDFGDGSTLSGTTALSASHTYSQSGFYTVVVTVSDGAFEATDSVDISVDRAPLISGSGITVTPSTTPRPGEILTFAVTATDPDTPTSSLSTSWDFGDGSTGNGATITHGYANSGIYTVTATVLDPGGLFDTSTVVIYVNEPPQIEGSGITVERDAPVPGTVVTFSVFASDPDNFPNPLQATWDFGDGSTGTGFSADHTYSAPGTYTVTVTVDDGANTAVASTTVVVSTPVTAQVSSARAKLDFKRSRRDGFNLKGTLPDLGGLPISNTSMDIDFGGAKFRVLMDSRGRGRSSNVRVKLSTNGKFSVGVRKTDLFAPFEKLGLLTDAGGDPVSLNSTAKKAVLQPVRLLIVLNGQAYTAYVSMEYTARRNRRGSMRSRR